MAVPEDLIGRVKAGDEHSFRQLIGPYQGELQLHCYRILGSAHDAEDALQETLLAAWRGLDSSEDSAASALKRARATMRHPFPPATTRQPPPRPDSPEERDLVGRFTRAYLDGDVAAVVALLTEDIVVTMPPLPLEYHGRDPVARFLAATGLRPGRRSRLVPTRANGQPAFGIYVHDPRAGISHSAGLLVLTLTGDKVCAMTGFDTSVPPLFGLPRTLPG